MISADAKANKNNNKQKTWWFYLTNFSGSILRGTLKT